MSKTAKLALAAAIPVLLLAGCSDFLKGPGLNSDPNHPSTATADQLWVGVEVAVMAQWENYPVMLFQTWAQQIAGVARQWQTYAEYDVSATSQTASEGVWNQTYGPGGFRDLRAVENAATSNGAIQWRGQARVLEALYIGTAADIFGDVPYSEALTGYPHFDAQATVYAHVQSVLDSAIIDLTSTDGKIPVTDFFYGSDPAKWTRLAHTLKARFLMHTAQTGVVAGVPQYSASILASVISEATAGIQSGGDLVAVHNAQPGSQNLFFSFQTSRAGDVGSGETHINQIKLQAADAFLLPAFYTPNAYGNYYGNTAAWNGSLITGMPADSMAGFEVAGDPSAAWPIVSYTENQMLLAEAQYLTGSASTALATLNAYRSANGSAAITPVPSGFAIQQYILREKYIRDFFNMEVWNDYLRTCYPNVPQPYGVDPASGYMPARMPVGQTEQSANPNVPPQPAGNPPNANNFQHPLALDGSTCIGQQYQVAP